MGFGLVHGGPIRMEWLESMVLGVIQGVTEFLPISSDGHLIVAAKLFSRFTGKFRGEDENVFFFVMLHVGTLGAILVHYHREILAGTRGFFGATDVPDDYRRASVFRIGVLVAIATAVLIPDKLFFLKWMKQAYESPAAVGVGFWITAAVLLVTLSKLSGGDKGPSQTTLPDALLIGIAQAFAPLPGVSRSGLTVAAALALGFRRTWAVQFSLMLAVPAIVGAAVFEIKDVDRSTLDADRIAQTVAATIVAGLVGYVAIVWLVRIVRSGRLWYFSVYLAALGLLVILGGSATKSPNHDRPAPSDDGASRPASARTSSRRIPTGSQGAVARPLAPVPTPGRG
jgi:undecaprenyl-diphosphatase